MLWLAGPYPYFKFVVWPVTVAVPAYLTSLAGWCVQAIHSRISLTMSTYPTTSLHSFSDVIRNRLTSPFSICLGIGLGAASYHLDRMGSILLQVKLVLVHSSNWTVNVCGHIAERMIGCCAEADSQADGEWRG
jgi:hypothetical protein